MVSHSQCSYLLSSSSPVIVKLVNPPTTLVEPWSVTGHPTEVFLCQLTINPVTTEPLGTLPVTLMDVAVVLGDVSITGARNGAVLNKLNTLGEKPNMRIVERLT